MSFTSCIKAQEAYGQERGGDANSPVAPAVLSNFEDFKATLDEDARECLNSILSEHGVMEAPKDDSSYALPATPDPAIATQTI